MNFFFQLNFIHYFESDWWFIDIQEENIQIPHKSEEIQASVEDA